MMRSITAAVLLLAACAGRQPASMSYDLDSVPAPAHGAAQLDAEVAVPQVGAPTWLRGTGIVYRLGYVVPSSPQPYALSHWAAPPAELLTAHLRERVASANGGFTLTATNSDAAAYLLEVSLEEFVQIFDTPSSSRCVVELRATLVNAEGKIVAQRTFRTEAPAPSSDAPGAVRGLIDAADAGIDSMLAWLAANSRSGASPKVTATSRNP